MRKHNFRYLFKFTFHTEQQIQNWIPVDFYPVLWSGSWILQNVVMELACYIHHPEKEIPISGSKSAYFYKKECNRVHHFDGFF